MGKVLRPEKFEVPIGVSTGPMKLNGVRDLLFNSVSEEAIVVIETLAGPGTAYGVVLQDGAALLGTLGFYVPPEVTELPLDALETFANLVTASLKKLYADNQRKEGEEKFSSFVSDSTYVYVELDLDGRLTFVNRRTEEMFGYTRAELLSMRYTDLIISEDLERAVSDWHEALTMPNDGPRDYSVITKSGSVKHAQFNTQPLKKNGVLVGFQVTALDMTDRKQAEDMLAESERRLAEQNKFNKLRADIWRLASDENLSEDDMIERLLNVIGPALDVSRACYNRKHGDDFECVAEWCDDGVKPSVGSALPGFLIKPLIQGDFIQLDREKALSMLPEEVRLLAEPAFVAFENELNLEYVVAAPYYVEGVMEGMITLDVCRDRPVKSVWTDEKRSILADVIQIVSQTIVQRRTERALEKAKSDLERRVEERTQELSSANLRLQQEVAERKRTEEALRASESLYRTLVETSPDGIALTDLTGKVVMANQRSAELFGCEKIEDLLGRSAFEFIMPEDRQRAIENARKTLEGGRVTSIEYKVAKKDGGYYDAELSASVLPDENGRPRAFVGVVRDITERRRATAALRDSEKRFRHVAENAMDIIWTITLDGRFSFVSSAVQQMLGYVPEEALKMRFEDLMPSDVMEQVRRAFAEELAKGPVPKNVAQVPRTVELQLRCKDGTLVWTESKMSFLRDEDGRPTGGIGVTRDITQRKRMEEELLKSRKLESLGILAGGIAHDFNNILTAVLGNLSLARARSSDREMEKALKAAEEATTQAKALTQQLLAFSRGGAPIKEAASVGELLTETVSFVLRGSNVEPVFSLPPDIWPVEVDKAQISQVINNLVINAKQAMSTGGTVEISARNVVLKGDEISSLPAGEYVSMSIKDTGEGIPRENLTKIFDPYFTTKPGGSGLGLTTSYYILKRHGGHISVESQVGVGSTFHVYLPASKKPPTGRKKDRTKLFFGKGAILVMDDEEVVRKAAESMLSYLGYRAVVVGNGQSALDAFTKARGARAPFDAVLMDLTIPGGMGGKETIPKILKVDPKAKVIVSSGYSDDPIMSEYQKYGFKGVLAKPYRLEDLSRALHRLLKSETD